jgi:hypothetical protein
MDCFELHETIERIERMELYFDLLLEAERADSAAIFGNPWTKAFLQTLIRYYENGQWLHDYELDEMGFLPPNLKRGVLSQDAIFDFLDRIKPIDE